MSPTLRNFAFVCALVGLAASVAAAYVHYQMLANPGYTSFCDVSATVSCTQVYSSRYGTFLGVPVAVFGSIWFLFAGLLTWAASSARASVRENVPGYLFVASTMGLAVILYLAYASFFVLNLVCVLCVVTYAAVIGLFLITGSTFSYPVSSLPRRAATDLKTLVSSGVGIAATVLFLGTAVSAVALFPREPGLRTAASTSAAAATADQRSDFERWYTAQPRVPIIVPAEGAKVLVVKFNDYQCPPCRQSYMDYKKVFEKYNQTNPGEVRLVLKDFPLESECNAAVTGGGPHPAACEAAVAVRLAREHNRADTLEEWLFANQPTVTADAIKAQAREMGQVTNFDARYAATLDLVKGDINYGRQLGVRSTPTFFINGLKVEGALPAVYFDQAIAYELQRAGAK